MLNPQPEAATVLHGLLDWIGRADEASQRGEAAPPPTGLDGKSLFPVSDWWLTDIERRSLDRQKGTAPDDAEEELDEASANKLKQAEIAKQQKAQKEKESENTRLEKIRLAKESKDKCVITLCSALNLGFRAPTQWFSVYSNDRGKLRD
jgi:hypothetical protein